MVVTWGKLFHLNYLKKIEGEDFLLHYFTVSLTCSRPLLSAIALPPSLTLSLSCDVNNWTAGNGGADIRGAELVDIGVRSSRH